MSFTGTPVVKLVADGLVRITGVSLVEGANGTIGLAESTGGPNIVLPAGFQPRTYSIDEDSPVTLQDAIEAAVTFTDIGAFKSAPGIEITKTGTTPQDFILDLDFTDSDEGGTTGPLEIYIRFH